MYLKHYGLSRRPFKLSSDPDFLWTGEKHKAALESLKDGILENKGFAADNTKPPEFCVAISNAKNSKRGGTQAWSRPQKTIHRTYRLLNLGGMHLGRGLPGFSPGPA